jgi:two-component system nitrogen regulation sensor histidine kinase GlnL
MNTSFIFSAALLGTLSLLSGVFVYAKNRTSTVNKTWMVLNFSASLWSWSLFARELSADKATALFFVRLCYVGAMFVPPLFFHFASSLIKQPRGKSILGFYLLSLIFLGFVFTPLFIKDVRPILSFRYYGIPGVLFPFFVVSFVSITGYSHYMLVKYLRESQGRVRNQIRYLLFATVIGFLGGGSTFLPVFNIELFPFGYYLISIYVAIISYAIVRHRLMDIDIVLKKGTTYALLLLLLFVPSFLLIIFIQRLFFNQINYLFSAAIFLILLLVALLFYRIKPETEKVVEQFLFKNRYDYRETLGTFSKAMVSILDLESLSKRIIETITQTMGVEKASLFLWDEGKGGYSLFESKNVKMSPPATLLLKNDPLPHYLQKIGEIIIREELAKGAKIPELNGVVNKMSLLESEVSIPLISKGQLVGMINLSHKFTKDIYSHEDIELLSTLANQTAVTIENARLYEDLKKSKSYIRRADRLASLGTLTAGLAHEIRNPLVAIKTLTQLLPERLDDEEFRDQFLKIAAGEVDRISSLVTELLEFARPSDPKLELEDINAILDGMILLVSTETKKKQIAIAKYYTSDLPPVQIDREQIKQVFLNILLNAIEATREGGEITVKTRSFMKPDGEPYVQVEFSDTGCGIPGEYLEDIFNPFFTTKSTGSGLGLSISNQIIQDHSGYINVESQLNKGSSFFINLPVNQQHPKRRKSDFENNQNIAVTFERR